MSERTRYVEGEFCWVDLMAHDLEQANLTSRSTVEGTLQSESQKLALGAPLVRLS